ncbi:MAG: helix-turn-helix transcriptional regulator [Planctomycetes bacterium]|nr:helix-turn-helix transcriptional regulator [Planctomycetota bacterium]
MTLPWQVSVEVVRCAQRRVATDLVQPLLTHWRLHWYGDPGASLHWRHRQFAMDAGVLAIIAPQTPFVRRVVRPVDRHVFVHFRPDHARDRITDRVWLLPCGVAPRALIDDLVRDLPGDGQPQVSAPWRGAALVLTALEAFTADDWPTRISDPRVLAALTRIDEDPAAAHGNAHLAEAAGMSESGFLRLFIRHVGVAPQRWAAQRRIAAACRLLQEATLPIAAIAARCGYCDRTYFTAAFTRAVGMGPGAYRRRAAGLGE